MSDPTQQRRTMVESQIQPCDIPSHSSKAILDVFESLPREKFIPRQLKRIAYMDDEFPLSHNRFMLRPQILARMIALADPTTHDKALYIGCGLGYGPAIFSQMVSSVTALESYEDLSQNAEENIKNADIKNVEVINGPLHEGWAEYSPYDFIFIEGKIETLPQSIVNQLRDGGHIVAIKQQVSGRTEAIKIHKKQSILTETPQFYANAPFLEGLALPPEFVFTN